ncbi:MAG TPA: hypothetical protein PK189_09240, partial [bacterium]|nr:hypothetical protein [bacterium]
MEIGIFILYCLFLYFNNILIIIETSLTAITKIQTQKLFKDIYGYKDSNIEKLRKILLQPQKFLMTLTLLNNFLKFLIP